MSDVLQAILSTVIAPAIAGFLAYLVTRRRETADIHKTSAEQNGIKADTTGKYRGYLNDEIERRRKAEEDRDMYEDACRELADENAALRSRVIELKEMLRKAGINAETQPRPRQNDNQGM